jgi:hypothetical protein
MPNTMRNRDYLAFIRSRVCWFCFSGATEPHHSIRHFRGIGSGGVGVKGSDYLTIPLCRPCHERIHLRRLERSEYLEIIITNLVCYITEAKSRQDRASRFSGSKV